MRPRGAAPSAQVTLNPLCLLNPHTSLPCPVLGSEGGLLVLPLLLWLTHCSWSAGEFPTLQNKMRAILRIEVEAVRFLKEEPHRLDSLLQRVRGLTDTLTMLRR